MLTIEQAKDIYDMADWFYGRHDYYEVMQIIEEVIERGIRDMHTEIEMTDRYEGGIADEKTRCDDHSERP